MKTYDSSGLFQLDDDGDDGTKFQQSQISHR